MSRWKSVRHAGAGLLTLVRSQVNARIHLAATAIVFAAAWWLRSPASDWCWLVVAVTLVWTAEAFNTAVELLGDATTDGAHHPLVGKSKDVAAAGVLLSAMGAALIGGIILLPRIWALFVRR